MLSSLRLSPHIIEDDGINLIDAGIRELGVPIGSPLFVHDFIENKKGKICNILHLVSQMCFWEESNINVDHSSPHRLYNSSFYSSAGKQVAVQMFRYIFNSRFSFLFRTCTPTEMISACTDIANEFQKVFVQTFHLPPLSPAQWHQVFSPFEFGGLGFVPLHATSVNAFSSSAISFIQHNSHTILPPFAFSSFLSSKSPLASSFLSAQSLADEVIAAASSSSSSAQLTRDSVRQLHFAEFSSRRSNSSFLETVTDPVEKHRLLSLSNSSAIAFLHAIPSSPELTCPSPVFPIVLANLLGLPFPRRLPRFCLCGSEIDAAGLHFQLCRQRAPQTAHNKICNEISVLARQGGATVHGPAQISHLDENDNKVADFRVESASPSCIDTIVDVQIRNTLAPSSFSSASRKPLPILDYAAKAKSEKHAASAASIHCSFTPFILDRFGNLGSEAKVLFDHLIALIPPDTFEAPNWAANSISAYWHQRFSVSLWSSLARESLILSVRASNAAASS